MVYVVARVGLPNAGLERERERNTPKRFPSPSSVQIRLSLVWEDCRKIAFSGKLSWGRQEESLLHFSKRGTVALCVCVCLCASSSSTESQRAVFFPTPYGMYTHGGELLLLVLYAIALSMSKMKLFHVCIFSHPFPVPVVVLIKLNATKNLLVSLIEVHMQREWENLCKTSRIGPHSTYPLLNDNYEMDNPSLIKAYHKK